MRVLEYGGHGVKVGLQSFRNPGPDTVFWSEKHMNSYVVVADERGPWRTPDGQRVACVSINGIGEVRWTTEPGSAVVGLNGEGAIEHFALTPWDGNKLR